MARARFLIALIALAFAVPALADQTGPKRRVLAADYIEKTLNGCAILEHWQDVLGGAGRSLFYFHRADGAWNKRMHPGWAGVGGITAALLARGGFIGTKKIYEGADGLFRSHTGNRFGEVDLGALTRDLGEKWLIEDVAIAPDGSRAYVTMSKTVAEGPDAGAIAVIDTTTRAVKARKEVLKMLADELNVHELIEEKTYDGIRIFRVVPGFVAQFGLTGDSTKDNAWRRRPVSRSGCRSGCLSGCRGW